MAVNSIPAVITARAGFRTMRDMRLPSFYGGFGSVTIRDAVDDDVPGILAIYNDVIATSTAVYREDPATLEELQWFNGWLRAVAQAYPVLVAGDGSGKHPRLRPTATFARGRAIGSASSTPCTSGPISAGGVGTLLMRGTDATGHRSREARDDRRRGRRQRGVAAISRAARIPCRRTCGRWESSSAAGSISSSSMRIWTRMTVPIPISSAQAARMMSRMFVR